MPILARFLIMGSSVLKKLPRVVRGAPVRGLRRAFEVVFFIEMGKGLHRGGITSVLPDQYPYR